MIPHICHNAFRMLQHPLIPIANRIALRHAFNAIGQQCRNILPLHFAFLPRHIGKHTKYPNTRIAFAQIRQFAPDKPVIIPVVADIKAGRMRPLNQIYQSFVQFFLYFKRTIPMPKKCACHIFSQKYLRWIFYIYFILYFNTKLNKINSRCEISCLDIFWR